MTDNTIESEDLSNETDQSTEGLESLTVDQLFNDSEESTEAKAEVETDDEKGDEAEVKTEAKKEEPPSSEEVSLEALEKKIAGLEAGIAAERTKRQEAEKKIPKEEIPDPVDDPEGYAQYLDRKNSNSDLKTRIDLSRDFMIDSKEDYV